LQVGWLGGQGPTLSAFSLDAGAAGVCVWDLSLPALALSLRPRRADVVVSQAAAGSSASTLMLGLSTGRVRVWDIRTRALGLAWRPVPATQIGGGKGGGLEGSLGVRSLAVGPDDRWVAAGLASGEVVVFDSAMGLVQNQWLAHAGGLCDLCKVGDSKLLTAGASDRLVCVWDLRTSPPTLVSRTLSPDPIRNLLCFGTDDVVMSSAAGTARLGFGYLGALGSASSAPISTRDRDHSDPRSGAAGTLVSRPRRDTVEGKSLGSALPPPSIRLAFHTLVGTKKPRTPISSLAVLPAYSFLVMGTDEGGLLFSHLHK
jgi:WD40 repeat protein